MWRYVLSSSYIVHQYCLYVVRIVYTSSSIQHSLKMVAARAATHTSWRRSKLTQGKNLKKILKILRTFLVRMTYGTCQCVGVYTRYEFLKYTCSLRGTVGFVPRLLGWCWSLKSEKNPKNTSKYCLWNDVQYVEIPANLQELWRILHGCGADLHFGKFLWGFVAEKFQKNYQNYCKRSSLMCFQVLTYHAQNMAGAIFFPKNRTEK